MTGHPDAATAAGLGDVLRTCSTSPGSSWRCPLGDERLLAVLARSRRPAARRAVRAAEPHRLGAGPVDALLTQFFGSTDVASLSAVPNFRRVYDAYASFASCGLNAAALISAITNAPTPDTVSALQSALRARYADADWLTVIRPVNDAAASSSGTRSSPTSCSSLATATRRRSSGSPARRMPRSGRPRSSATAWQGSRPA